MKKEWRVNGKRVTLNLALGYLTAGLTAFSMTVSPLAMAISPASPPGLATTLAAPSIVKAPRFYESGTTTSVVMETSGLPQDVQIRDELGGTMTVTLAGTIPGDFKSLNKAYKWPNLKGVFVEQRNGKVQMFIKRGYVGTVDVKTEPRRLVVQIPHFKYKLNPNDEVSPGVKYLQLSRSTPQGPVRVNVIEIDPRHPGLEIMPALASQQMGSKANVASMVQNYQAVAGINGSFFKQDKGIPLGILIINQELVSGPLYDRVALGITQNNEAVMSRVRLGGEVILPDGRSIRLHNINQPRVIPNTTVVYTSRWGYRAPAMPKDGIQIQLRDNRVTDVSTREPLTIPRNGVVISGILTPEMEALAHLTPQRPVQLNVYTLPDWSEMKHAIGGGPWLVKNGQPFVDLQAQHFTSKSLGFREPRSAVGITRNGKLLLVAVDGRQKGSSIGMTLTELAHFMQSMGAVNAMNLDGGSSTQMAVYGKIVNQPSSGNIGVSNSLLVRRTHDDNVATRPTDTRPGR